MSATPTVVPAAPPARSPYASPTGLAIALSVLFALVMGTDALALHADWTMRALADRLAADPGAVGDAEADRATRLIGLTGTFQGNATIVTGIVFLVWFHRVRANAELFAPGAGRLGRGWAVGAWFVPLANLWLPYRIAATTWTSSTPAGAGAGRRGFGPSLVSLWWGGFVLSKLLGWYGGRSYSRAETPEAVRDAATTMLAGDVVDLAAAVLAVLLVRRLTAMQRVRAAQGPPVATARRPALG
ncbi:DUF4328 domain-containing protein [Streptomyces sp. NPDC047976]|uniref:DUF4328 domain-containing protein n=1 Tax=Streptomyces sp. NPDC047976 TaxID=3155746 RepID=UPI003426911C